MSTSTFKAAKRSIRRSRRAARSTSRFVKLV